MPRTHFPCYHGFSPPLIVGKERHTHDMLCFSFCSCVYDSDKNLLLPPKTGGRVSWILRVYDSTNSWQPFLCFRAGVPNPRASDQYWSHGLLGTGPHSRRWAAGQRGSFICLSLPVAPPHCSHYLLNHPPPAPTIHGEIVFHETGPWCQEVGDRCFRELAQKHVHYGYDFTWEGVCSGHVPSLLTWLTWTRSVFQTKRAVPPGRCEEQVPEQHFFQG